MIPDKIYITKDEIEDCGDRETRTMFCGNVQAEGTDVEYIRKEALPRWKKGVQGQELGEDCVISYPAYMTTGHYLMIDAYYLPIKDLVNLPKEDED